SRRSASPSSRRSASPSYLRHARTVEMFGRQFADLTRAEKKGLQTVKIFGDLDGLQALLVGAAELSELSAEHLNGSGVTQIFVANRSHDRAKELASRFNGQAVYFESIEPHLATCDIVIASTSAPHFVIEPGHVQRALRVRKKPALFLIDL